MPILVDSLYITMLTAHVHFLTAHQQLLLTSLPARDLAGFLPSGQTGLAGINILIMSSGVVDIKQDYYQDIAHSPCI